MSVLLGDVNWADLDMEAVLANSHKDFHCKGLDYLCLHRDAGLTLKAYFFEDKIQDAAEVVNPHNHRYDFATECISGRVANYLFHRYNTDPPPGFLSHRPGEIYNTFAWRTPLNGGNGFTPIGATRLQIISSFSYPPGHGYYMGAEELHTIQIVAPETCIVLAQYEDTVPVGEPTLTFSKSETPPDLTGLYNKFTADQAMQRIKLLQELTA